MTPLPTTTSLLSSPMAKLRLDMQEYLYPLLLRYGNIYNPPSKGVYLKNGIDQFPKEHVGGYYVSIEGKYTEIPLEDVLSNKYNQLVLNKHLEVILHPKQLAPGLFHDRATEHANAYKALFAIARSAFLDEYRLKPGHRHLVPPEKYIREEYHDLVNHGALENVTWELITEIGGFLDPYPHHYMDIVRIGRIMEVSVYCDFRVYEWTLERELMDVE